MKTNFTNTRNYVLMNEDKNPAAVIKCEAGKNDISEKIKQAISESMDAEITNYLYEKELTNDDYEIAFYCEMTLSDDENIHSERFTLFLTEIY